MRQKLIVPTVLFLAVTQSAAFAQTFTRNSSDVEHMTIQKSFDDFSKGLSTQGERMLAARLTAEESATKRGHLNSLNNRLTEIAREEMFQDGQLHMMLSGGATYANQTIENVAGANRGGFFGLGATSPSTDSLLNGELGDLTGTGTSTSSTTRTNSVLNTGSARSSSTNVSRTTSSSSLGAAGTSQ